MRRAEENGKTMGLRTKFNLVLVVAFAIGLALAGLLSLQIVERNATDEVVQNAQIMIEAATAIREYTSTEISPLLSVQMEEFGTFLPHSVPSFAAQRNFETVRQKFPEFVYREAALNPTNLDDRRTRSRPRSSRGSAPSRPSASRSSTTRPRTAAIWCWRGRSGPAPRAALPATACRQWRPRR